MGNETVEVMTKESCYKSDLSERLVSFDSLIVTSPLHVSYSYFTYLITYFDSASNRDEYQEYFLGVKVLGA